ncbi:MAG: RsmD family RNA methyltransferase [Bacteroidota bacterium]
MRIIGGNWKGRTWPVDRNFSGRPTTDFAKEALFNILESHFNIEEFEQVWDLFSGTGAIAAELLSRGAQNVTSVEMNSKNARALSLNKRNFELKNWQIVVDDVKKFLSKQEKLPQMVFADPPFDLPWINELPEILFEKKSEAFQLIVIEHPKEVKFEDAPHFWQARVYGHVHFSFFKNSEL